MKRIILTAALLFATLASFCQTAIDFTLTDCDSYSQHLYSILDQGKVVILIYEHECGSCTQGTANVTNVLNANYPGDTNIIVMYLDNGGNSCATTANWISTNNFVPGPSFEYSADNSSPYGSGMPIVVIAAGSDHQTFLQALGVAYADTVSVLNALEAAFNHLSGLAPTGISAFSINVYPNPSNDQLIIEVPVLKEESTISIFQMNGQLVMQEKSKQPKTNLDVSKWAPGIYMVKIENQELTAKKMFLKE